MLTGSDLICTRFTLRTDHKSLVWLHRFKDTEGMLSRMVAFFATISVSIIHRPGKDHVSTVWDANWSD